MSREADLFSKIMMDGRLSRREAMLKLSALGLAAPLASTLASHGRSAEAAAAPALARQDAGSGVLIVGTETDIEGFDPGHAGALATTRVINNVLEGLVKYTPGTVELQPHLALEIPTKENGGITEDGLTYTFKLREGVTFHDGTPLDAEAVRTSYRRLYDKEFEFYDATNTSGFFLTGLQSVDVVDPMTVSFTLAKPNAAFIEMSNIFSGKLMSPKAIAELPAEQWAEGSFGTGPFKLNAWEKGAKVELVRNEEYWGDKPALQTLIFRPIPEPTARVSALLGGEVDMIVVVPPDSIQAIKDNPDLTYEQGPSLHYWFIQLNTKEPPFDNKKVRQAVNYAIDKQGLAEAILAGSAEPATQPMPAANWSYNPDVAGYPYDPEKAKALLAEAGYENGFKTGMMIPQSGSGMMVPVPMNEFIASNLRDVGIEVEIQSYEWVSYLGIWGQGLTTDVTLGNQSIMASEPYVADFLLASGFTPTDGGWNIGYYGNPEVDKLLGEALIHPDKETRKELYHKAWELITDDAPWIFVVNDLQPMAFKKSVKGYLTNPAYVIDFTTISVE
jgi:peptide/nickel transport system substrate-binding protein